MATVHCGQSGGQWTVHQVVDSLADSLADAVVVTCVPAEFDPIIYHASMPVHRPGALGVAPGLLPIVTVIQWYTSMIYLTQTADRNGPGSTCWGRTHLSSSVAKWYARGRAERKGAL